MKISPELMAILVCPVCKTALEMREEPQGLKCTNCRRVYPVRDEIPVMLPEEATIDPE